VHDACSTGEGGAGKRLRGAYAANRPYEPARGEGREGAGVGKKKGENASSLFTCVQQGRQRVSNWGYEELRVNTDWSRAQDTGAEFPSNL